MQEQFSTDFVERFWIYVAVGPKDQCWDWQGPFWKSGYGVFHFKGRRWRAHRAAYEIASGPIPKGFWVNHTCDRPCCVNPAHLWVGDAKDGIGDCARKGRKTRGEGHPAAKLTEEQVLEIRRRIQLRKHGHGSTALAREFGVAPCTIQAIRDGKKWAWLSEENMGQSAHPLDPCEPQLIDGKATRCRGQFKNSSKLTSAAVVDIRRLHKQGCSRKAIAEKYAVKTTTISAVLTGRSWAWLKDESVDV